MTNTRRENAIAVARALPEIAKVLVGIGYMMVAAILVIAPAVIVLCFPAAIAHIASPFVGMVSPETGRRLASLLDPAAVRYERVFDFVMKPLDRLYV